MTSARQLLVAALAAATLAITAAPAMPTGPDLSGYSWKPIYGATDTALANGTIYAIKSVGNDLYLGGDFTDFAGKNAADHLVHWNNTAQEWQGVGSVGEGDGAISAGSVRAIETSGNELYIGGDFTVTDYLGNPRVNLAHYNMGDPSFVGYWHSEWYGFDCLGCGTDLIANGRVDTLFANTIDGGLYVGGTFTNAGATADYLIVGIYSACFTVLGACSEPPPHVSACGGVGIACAINVPNTWRKASDNADDGQALNEFVSSISAHPDGGVIVGGNFTNAGGVTGANYLARFVGPYDSYAWVAQSGLPTATMYTTTNFEGTLYAAGWQGAYRRTAGTSWEEICPSTLHTTGLNWTGLAVMSDSLVFVGSANGLYACNPTTGGATQVLSSTAVVSLAVHNGELIVAAGLSTGGLGDAGNYVARYSADLPPTNRDANRNTNTTLLLIALAALTGLAGVQIRRRA